MGSSIHVNGPTWSTPLSNGLVQSLVARSKAGELLTGLVYNTTAATRYVHIFNATSLPADTTVPALPPLVVAAGTNVALDVFTGVYFDTGITIVSSTTDDTLTAGGASDFFIWATGR